MTPADAPRLVRLAALGLQEKDWALAEGAATMAAHAQPTCVEAWVALGAARALNGDHANAAAAYVKALALSPRDVACWCALGECYVTLMRYQEAAVALKQAMLLDPDAKHPAGRRARAVASKTMAQLRKA